MTYQSRPEYEAPGDIRCQAIVPGHPSWHFEWMRHDHQCPRKANQMRGPYRVCYQHAAMKKPPRYVATMEKAMNENVTESVSTVASADAMLVRAARGDIWRHKARGSLYEIVGYGRVQASNWYRDSYAENTDYLSVDMDDVIIYQAKGDDTLWVRPVDEFHDGRFEFVASAHKSKHWTDEEWAKIPLVLKQRFWLETDYGERKPTAALYAEMNAFCRESK